MTDYAALKAEIAKPAYNGMTDAQIGAAVTALTVPGLQRVDPSQAMIQLMRIGDWGWLAGVANGWVTSANASGAGAVAVSATTPWATRRLAQTIYDLLRASLTLDMTVQANVDAISSALTALVTANVITTAGRVAVIGLPVSSTRWIDIYGFAVVGAPEVAAARSFNG